MLKNIKRVIGNTIINADTKRIEASMKIKSVVPTSFNEVLDVGNTVKNNIIKK